MFFQSVYKFVISDSAKAERGRMIMAIIDNQCSATIRWNPLFYFLHNCYAVGWHCELISYLLFQWSQAHPMQLIDSVLEYFDGRWRFWLWSWTWRWHKSEELIPAISLRVNQSLTSAADQGIEFYWELINSKNSRKYRSIYSNWCIGIA